MDFEKNTSETRIRLTWTLITNLKGNETIHIQMSAWKVTFVESLRASMNWCDLTFFDLKEQSEASDLDQE